MTETVGSNPTTSVERKRMVTSLKFRSRIKRPKQNDLQKTSNLMSFFYKNHKLNHFTYKKIINLNKTLVFTIKYVIIVMKSKFLNSI